MMHVTATNDRSLAAHRLPPIALLALAVVACHGATGSTAQAPTTGSGSAPLIASPATIDCTSAKNNCALCTHGLFTLLPNDTDPLLGVTGKGKYGTNPSAPYCYAKPASSENNLLFVFLPGSGAVPTQYQKILVQARALGYYVLSLSWPNGTYNGTNVLATDLTAICKDQTSGPDCWSEVRFNRFNGTTETDNKQSEQGHCSNDPCWDDPYMVQSPSSADQSGLGSVNDRLVKALIYLKWTQFLNGAQTGPTWGKIVLGGHSQGGGLAAFIGSKRAVKGVVTFSSPDDAKSQDGPQWTCASDGPTPPALATWVTKPFASTTPLSAYVGLLGCTDVGFAQVVTVWSKLAGPSGSAPSSLPGYIGSGVNVDAPNHPPYLQAGAPSHRLLTKALLPGIPQINSHDATVLDTATPDCPGHETNSDNSPNPQLKPAWQQMLILAGGLRWTAAQTCAAEAQPPPP